MNHFSGSKHSARISEIGGKFFKRSFTQLVNSKKDITRAPRGTDRSPEYNEHFCYKLDSRVKI